MDATLESVTNRTVHIPALPVLAQERVAAVKATVRAKAKKMGLPDDAVSMLADCASQAAADVYESGHL